MFVSKLYTEVFQTIKSFFRRLVVSNNREFLGAPCSVHSEPKVGKSVEVCDHGRTRGHRLVHFQVVASPGT